MKFLLISCTRNVQLNFERKNLVRFGEKKFGENYNNNQVYIKYIQSITYMQLICNRKEFIGLAIVFFAMISSITRSIWQSGA